MIQNHLPHDHGQTIEHELEYMPSVENFQTVADIFKQLGDDIFLEIRGFMGCCRLLRSRIFVCLCRLL